MGRRKTFTERKGFTKTLALGTGLLVAGTALAAAGGSPFGGQETRGQQVTQRGDVIISELMVEGSGGTGQFIELHNTTGSNIDIKNWVLKGNRTISITILRSVVIPANGEVVLGPDRRTGTGIPVDYAYSQTLYLSQSGPYTLQLQQGSTVIDTVTYDPATWPISAGASMQLDPDFLTATANDSLDNWCASSSPIPNFEPILGTPGEPNDLCNEGAPDNDGDGFSTIDGDCDDNDASVHPGAEELCDGLDNDCNDLVDDGATTVYYADRDKDGYGDPGSSVDACSPPSGYVSNSSDCNDSDAAVKPGASEACDGVDNNCNSQIDEGLAGTRYYADLDGDTYGDSSNFVDACVAPFGYVTRGGDCNDGNPAVNPGATEKCDSVDNNCNGSVDEGVTTTYYVDNDLDTYGSSQTVQACSQPSGTATRSGDCDDNANGVNPGAAESCNGKDDNCNGQVDDGVTTQTFYADKDKDGFGDPASTTTACTAPTGYVSNNTDCNDNNPSVKPGATEVCNTIDDNCNGSVDEGVQNTYYQDADGDTYGNPNKTAQGCTAPTGYVSNKTDCDDTSATVNPGATELCNSKDDNCNGLVDDNVGSTTYYQDSDGDTFGNPAVSTTACAAPTGYVTNNKDCNDSSAAVNPNATEVCNGVDDNCSGSIDEGVKTNYYVDADKDGYGKAGSTPTAACTAPTGYVNNNSDCDDASATVNPAAVEQCNSLDDNCNGQIDEGVTNSTWYQDADGDGYGNAAVTKSACAKPAGYVSNSTDCNDADATIKPGATETCNSKDDNCNGTVDEGVGTTYYQDNDADGYGSATTTVACSKPTGYATVGGDCNDASATVKPGAVEQCNGVDDDCDGTIDDGVTNSTWYQDSDGDGYGNSAVTKSACSQPAGYVSNSTDCNDTNAAVKPGATETCNGIDDNCSGAIDEGVKTTYYQDNDADGYGSTTTTQACTKPAGYATVGGDCNDASATVKPGAVEQCNGVDDDCDGTIDDGVTSSTWYQDSDGDGYGNAAVTKSACSQPAGYVSNSTDCNDADATIKPGATETCNSKDDNCNGTVDEGVGTTYYQDNDADGYGSTTTTVACAKPAGYATVGGDCNDASATVKPGAAETCNGVDDNCNGTTDEGVGTTWYKDADNDGYGVSTNTTTACTKPTGYAAQAGDCNDASATINPGAPEQCNSVDDDCDGVVDDGVTNTTWYRDADNDNYGISTDTKSACSKPAGYVAQSGDCNDADATINPGATESCNSKDDNCNGTTDEGVTTTYYRDADGDGYGVSTTTTQACSLPTGYATVSGDCNDASATVKPGATETCNGVDDNCNGTIDDGVTNSTWYQDSDGDGYGNAAVTKSVCSQPAGYVSNSTDCNDADATIKPGATETCNSKDDNCNGTVDEGVGTTWYKDTDGDGYGVSTTTTVSCTKPTGYAAASGDCNDAAATIYPGAVEQCNSVDDDCDGTIDDGVTNSTWYQDSDGDGYGNSAVTKSACSQPAGYVSNSTDCNDTNAAVKPGATETCNGIDDNCSGAIDEGVKTTYYQDNDADGYGSTTTTQACTKPTGYATVGGDCNDASATVKPGAAELCNGVDDDCDGTIDDGVTTSTWYQDSDGDGYGNSAVTKSACSQPAGYVSNSTDCNDADATIKPGATETCNSKDDNCNGTVDEGVGTTWYKDTDGDGYGVSTTTTVSCTKPTGYAAASGDCNDAAATIYPGAVEQCNSVDDDCDGTIDDGVTNSTWYQDSDGDGYGNAAVTKSACSQPAGYVSNSTDCNDADATIKPGATETCNSKDDNCNGTVDEGVGTTYYQDNDADGYGSTTTTVACAKPTGYATVGGDCNDASATVKPGATELCNSVDDDCDGTIDDGVTNSTWYQDSDGDGYGNSAVTKSACSQPAGYVSNSTDCNDTNAAVKPGATETCNGIDDNCSGAIDEGVKTTYYQDNDADGYGSTTTTQACTKPTGYATVDGDCNDASATVKPGAAELCNGVDDDCDGTIDDGVTNSTWYQDSDGDGYGNAAVTKSACSQPAGYVSNSTDCNDADATIKPGATETCNSKDDNCNGTVDEGVGTTYYQDNDADGYGSTTTTVACAKPTGYATVGGDCNDASATVKPGATELCNSVDDDCDGTIDDGVTNSTWYQDSDGDGYGNSAVTKSACSQPAGYVSNSTDCNDTNAAVKPGATETCNGIDDNCSGAIDEGVKTTYYQDNDADGYGSTTTTQACTKPTGYATVGGDCNDASATVKPGATELCNGVDDNCNGTVDEGVTSSTWYQDSDGDGYGNSAVTKSACTQPAGYVSNSTDCNDTNAAVKPGATETCNGIDDNCSGAIDEGVGSTYYQDNDADGYGSTTTTVACAKPTGYATVGGDCNDANAAVKPGATETCNGIDDNCSGTIDEGTSATTWYQDTDGDGQGVSTQTTTACVKPTGYAATSGDCNDADADIYTGAPELCDTKDNDCNGSRDEKIFSGTQPTGYSGTCGVHYMVPVEGMMAAPTSAALAPIIVFETISGATTSSFLSGTAGADGHVGNIKGTITGSDGSTYTLGACTVDAKIAYRATCASIAAGTFKANTTYTFNFTHTQKADGTGWKIAMKGKFTTKSPCGATWNTKPGFKFTKFGSTSSLTLNLMNTAANNNTIQLGATFVDVPKTSTLPVSSFKLALGGFTEASGSASYTYRAPYGASAVIPGASLSSTGALALPTGNVSVPTPATSTTMSFMFVYNAVMAGTITSSGNLSTWSGYTLSGIVTKKDMDLFFSDSGNSIGVSYDISNYTPTGGVAQGPAANVTMTATPSSTTMSSAVCP